MVGLFEKMNQPPGSFSSSFSPVSGPTVSTPWVLKSPNSRVLSPESPASEASVAYWALRASTAALSSFDPAVRCALNTIADSPATSTSTCSAVRFSPLGSLAPRSWRATRGLPFASRCRLASGPSSTALP